MKITKLQLREIIREVIREADESDKYSHIGYGKYKEKGKEDDKDAQTFQKTDSGKFEPFSDKEGGEKEKSEPKVTKIAADPFADKDSETGKDYTRKFMGTDEPEDDIYAYDPSTPDVEKHADTIMAITKDDVEFDGYDANDRPMFVSSDDPDLEYTVDKKGNIWRHDGFKDKVIGTTSAGADKSSVTPIDNDKGVKRMAASIEKKTNVSPGSLELQGRTKANDGTSIIQWKDKSDGTLMGISDDGSVYEGGKKTSYKADQDSFKESIMPQLKKEFKQYGFAQKSKNWKQVTI